MRSAARRRARRRAGARQRARDDDRPPRLHRPRRGPRRAGRRAAGARVKLVSLRRAAGSARAPRASSATPGTSSCTTTPVANVHWDRQYDEFPDLPARPRSTRTTARRRVATPSRSRSARTSCPTTAGTRRSSRHSPARPATARLGARDHDRRRPARQGPAAGRCSTAMRQAVAARGLGRPRRARPAELEAPLSADRRSSATSSGAATTARSRPVAAGPRAARARELVRVAPRSMRIAGTVAEWEELDRDALPRQRRVRRPRRARRRSRSTASGRGRLRRAQRLDAPQRV